MPITSDPNAMAEAERALRSMTAKEQWLAELALRVSVSGMKLVADEFRTSADPYGQAWEALKKLSTRDRRAMRRAIRAGKTPRGPKLLIRSGRMRASLGAAASGRTARVTMPTWYARFHQEGTVKMRQRMILPDSDRGLPDKWDAMIAAESQRFVAQKFGVRP
jgi:phage gpG-like protein